MTFVRHRSSFLFVISYYFLFHFLILNNNILYSQASPLNLNDELSEQQQQQQPIRTFFKQQHKRADDLTKLWYQQQPNYNNLNNILQNNPMLMGSAASMPARTTAQQIGVNPQLGNLLFQQQLMQQNGLMGSFANGINAATNSPQRLQASKQRKFNLQTSTPPTDSSFDEHDDSSFSDSSDFYGSSSSNSGDSSQKLSSADSSTNTYANLEALSPLKLDPSNQHHQCGIMKPILTNYVAGGKKMNPIEQPWYAQLTIGGLTRNDSSTFCGGTLISRHHILTAAHCYDEISVKLRAKSTLITMKGVLIDEDKYYPTKNGAVSTSKKKNGKPKKVPLQFRATHVYLHHHYVPAMTELEARLLHKTPGPKHDLAIVEFEFEDKEISEVLIPACLPSEGTHVKPGTKCKVMGHGFMNAEDEDNFIMPTELQSADVSISTNQMCRDEVDSMSIKSKISHDTLCIRGPMHPCVGDSGGPLVCALSTTSTDDQLTNKRKRKKKTVKHDNDEKRKRRNSDAANGDEEEVVEEEEDEDATADDTVEEEEEEVQLSSSNEKIVSTNFHLHHKRYYLVGVTSFAVSTDQHDRCGQFRSAVFAKIANYISWIRTITG